MATGKRYYFTKLKESWLNSDPIQYLLDLPKGTDFFVLFILLIDLSKNTGGRLERRVGKASFPFDIPSITRECKRFPEDTVLSGIKLFETLELISKDSSGTYIIEGYDAFVGEETDYAEQKRRQRERKVGVDTPMDNPMDNVHFNVHPSVHSESNTVVAVDTPMDTPMDNPMDTPMDNPMDTPMDNPMDNPMDTPMDTPMDNPMDNVHPSVHRVVHADIREEILDNTISKKESSIKPNNYMAENQENNGNTLFSEDDAPTLGSEGLKEDPLKEQSEEMVTTVSQPNDSGSEGDNVVTTETPPREAEGDNSVTIKASQAGRSSPVRKVTTLSQSQKSTQQEKRKNKIRSRIGYDTIRASLFPFAARALEDGGDEGYTVLDEIVSVIADTEAADAPRIKIAGGSVETDVVRAAFSALDQKDVLCVLANYEQRIKEHGPIPNLKDYLAALLLNVRSSPVLKQLTVPTAQFKQVAVAAQENI